MIPSFFLYPAMSKEIYIGRGEITNLGETNKQGAFLTLKFDELASGIVELLEDVDPDDISVIKLKVLPLKTENVKKGYSHSVKLIGLE